MSGAVPEFLAGLVLPPCFEARHGEGEGRIEVQIHAAVDGGDGAGGVETIFEGPAIACLKDAGFKHAEVEAGAVFEDRELDEVGAADAAGEVGAGNAWAAYLDECGSEANAIAYADLVFCDFTESDVFADGAGFEIELK